MQIRILMIGKVRELYLKDGISVYLQRLSSVHRVSITELPEEKISGRSSLGKEKEKRNTEGIRLLERSEPAGVVIALDVRGEPWTSDELASRMKIFELEGGGPVVFLIGGSLGLSPHVLARADKVLSLSPMTFPHQLVPLLLLEQIYRADCINRNIPYHK